MSETSFTALVVTALLLLLGGGFIGCSAACHGIHYSEGQRIGVVTKLSKKGFVFETWEGELTVAGLTAVDGGGLGANIFEFTVKDMAILERVQAAMNAREVVALTYDQRGCGVPWNGNTAYFITGVEKEVKCQQVK